MLLVPALPLSLAQGPQLLDLAFGKEAFQALRPYFRRGGAGAVLAQRHGRMAGGPVQHQRAPWRRIAGAAAAATPAALAAVPALQALLAKIGGPVPCLLCLPPSVP